MGFPMMPRPMKPTLLIGLDSRRINRRDAEAQRIAERTFWLSAAGY
jgi:hypothetical protein